LNLKELYKKLCLYIFQIFYLQNELLKWNLILNFQSLTIKVKRFIHV